MTDDMTQMEALSSLLTFIKSTFLDSRNIGIRRFAEMTNIRRTRLNQLFEGIVTPTVEEVSRINIAIGQIDAKHKRTQEKRIKGDDQIRALRKEVSDKATESLSGVVGYLHGSESQTDTPLVGIEALHLPDLHSLAS